MRRLALDVGRQMQVNYIDMDRKGERDVAFGSLSEQCECAGRMKCPPLEFNIGL